MLIEGTRILTEQNRVQKVEGIFELKGQVKQIYKLIINDGSEIFVPYNLKLLGARFDSNVTGGWNKLQAWQLWKNKKIKFHNKVIEGTLEIKSAFLKGCHVRMGDFDLNIFNNYPVLMKKLEEEKALENDILWHTLYRRNLPDEIYNWKNEYIHQFLSGFFSAAKAEVGRLHFHCQEVKFLRQLQLLCKMVGYTPAVWKHQGYWLLEFKYADVYNLGNRIENPRIKVPSYLNKKKKPRGFRTIDYMYPIYGNFNIYGQKEESELIISGGIVVLC